MVNAERMTLAAGHGLIAATTVANTWIDVFRYAIPAQTAMAWGYNVAGAPDGEVGAIYVDLQTVAPANIDGELMLCFLNTHGEIMPGVTYRTEELRLGAADRRLRIKLPYQGVISNFPNTMLIRLLGDTAGQLINIAASNVFIDCTRIRKKTV